MRLTENQDKVLEFLKHQKNEFISPTDIGYYVGRMNSAGIWRDSSWASPICKSLVKKGLVERNDKGYYKAI